MTIVITRRAPGIAGSAGFTADTIRAAGTKWKGIRMPLSWKIGPVALIAIAVCSGTGLAQSTDTGSTPAPDPALAQNTNVQYGVFREVVPTAPVSQRNCWVQGLVSGETINGDLLTERVTLTQAQCVLNYLTRRGQCASERTTPYWSARSDGTSDSGSNGGTSQWGSNNWQSTNASQGGGAQSGGASQTSGQGQHGGWQNGGGSQNGGNSQSGEQWTRGGEWSEHGGVSSARLNAICGGGTASGTGTGSGTTSN
jgi:hypothetical protein